MKIFTMKHVGYSCKNVEKIAQVLLLLSGDQYIVKFYADLVLYFTCYTIFLP